MSKLDLVARLGEREERVRVRRMSGGGGYEVTVGERAYQVDHAAPAPGVHSLIVHGSHHEVTTRRMADGSWAVATGGATTVVEVADPLTYLARQSAGGGAGRRSRRVEAYMPGRVAGVLVEEGAEVRAGQGVVVLEAMKMQNEILAEHDGVVSRVFVSPGQAVEKGDPLFEME
ncbi:MAG TPA: biotin/lipoyl-containing protein [Thermoanaerobaculia bacterium]|nr:biotin/lipoyl-containing protein [Thermoanaerobaculia bacterium]